MKIIKELIGKKIISLEDYELLQEYKNIIANKSRKILLEASKTPDTLVNVEQSIIEKSVLQSYHYVKHTHNFGSIIIIISDPVHMKNRLRNLGGSLLLNSAEEKVDSFELEMEYINRIENAEKLNPKIKRDELNIFSSHIQYIFQLAGKKDGAILFNTYGELCGTQQNIEGVARKSVEHILEHITLSGSGTTAAAYLANEVPNSFCLKISGEGAEKGRILGFHGSKVVFKFNPKKFNTPIIDLYNIIDSKK